MTSPQFPARSRVLRPESYQAAARRVRRMADALEARSAPQTPREQAALTSAIHTLSHYAQDLSRRHRRSRE